MRSSLCILALLLVTGCTNRDADPALSPGRAEEGDWVSFYSRASEAGQRQYFYDRSRIQRRGDVVAARWKITGAGDSATTLYVLEIECRRGTFTERGTVQIDAGGRSREIPRSELLVARPIEANSSTATFRQMFCR
jgi:hypothetical protein